jgi:hypothetical protein
MKFQLCSSYLHNERSRGSPDGIRTSPIYMYLKSVEKVEVKAAPGGNISKEDPAEAWLDLFSLLKLKSEKQRTI